MSSEKNLSGEPEGQEPLLPNHQTLPDEKKSLLRNGIGSRLRMLVVAKTTEKKRFEALEQATGISKATWRTWWRRETTPTGKLVEAAAKAWPEHAFWLSCGLTDVEAGHNMPYPPPPIVRAYINTYPESPFFASAKVSTWYMYSDDPGGLSRSLGEWPKGVKDFLDLTAEYLKLSLQLKKADWDCHYYSVGATAQMDVLESLRLEIRKRRWNLARDIFDSDSHDDQAS